MPFFEEGVGWGHTFQRNSQGGGVILSNMGEKVTFINGEKIGYCNINFLSDIPVSLE